MKVYLAQINPTIGDLEGNTKRIIQAIENAKKKRADVVLFSEMTICGYPPEDLVLHHEFIEETERQLQIITMQTDGIMAIVGLVRRNPHRGEKSLLNSAAVIHNQKILGFVDKKLLPTYDVFDERRYYEPGHETKIFELQGKKISITICEDIWQHGGYIGDTCYKCDPIMDIAPFQPDVHFNLTASPYQMQKPELRVEVCKRTAETLKCPMIMCCQVGANSSIIFDGSSTYVNARGELIHLAKSFEEDEVLFDLDHPKTKSTPIYPTYSNVLEALKLGVKDYFRKNGFKTACLGLSGGVDSALVAYIACRALGSENVTGILMPSDFSTESSLTDAYALAKNLGMKTETIPIKEPYKGMIEILKPLFGNRPFDVTEENLQARIRGVLLMAISNKLGHIVLSTGNKSETALGYSTLYGDMCGGLAVIGDVKKTLAYDLCRYINTKKEIIPNNTIVKPPSAELRPDQTDFDSLPDYQIVDHVLEGYVEENLSFEEIAEKYDIPLELVMNLVRMIHKAEYKRRQGPPTLRITKKAFGVGRLYPLVQKFH